MDASPLTIWLVKLSLLLVIIVLAARNLLQTWREAQSGRWPQTRARALTSKVVEASLGGRRGFLGSHTWQVTWQYEVDGRSYTSPLQQPFPVTSEGNAKMMAARIGAGDSFDIRYDPSDPRTSRIATGMTNAWIQFWLRVGVYCVAIGVAIWAIIYL